MITITLQFDTIADAAAYLSNNDSTPAPQQTDDSAEELTPQQKAAATRAKNKAIREARAAITQPAKAPVSAPDSTAPAAPPVAAPVAAPDAAAPVSMTADQLRTELSGLAQKMGDSGATLAGIMQTQFNVAKLSELEPVNYSPYLDACRAAAQ